MKIWSVMLFCGIIICAILICKVCGCFRSEYERAVELERDVREKLGEARAEGSRRAEKDIEAMDAYRRIYDSL